MSHAVVLVALPEKPTDELIDKAMMPYHEYECTGIKEYLQKIDVTDEIKQEYEKYNKGETFDEYIDNEYGDEEDFYIRENDKIYKITNPNAKWDWYQIGGRYSDFMPSYMFNTMSQYMNSNLIFQKKDVDFGINDNKKSIVHQLFEEIKVFVDEMYKNGIDLLHLNEEGSTLYKYFTRLKNSDILSDNVSDALCYAGFYNIIKGDITEEKYIDKYLKNTPFALLYNGEWYEYGKLGWWATVSGENDNWDNDFLKIWETIPDDYWIVVVDYHI